MKRLGAWCILSLGVAAGSLTGAGLGCDILGTTGGAGGAGGAGGDAGAGGGGKGGGGGDDVCQIAPEPDPPGPEDLFPLGDTHWIAIDPTGQCASLPASPATAVWEGRRLFEGSIGKVNVVNVGGSLSTYCGYEWVDPDPADPANVPSAADLALLAPFAPAVDRRVAPQGTLDWVRETFFQNVHWGLKAPAVEEPRVRVLVWDTRKYGVPAPNGLPGTNSHGHAMADVVQEVACPPSGPCAVQVETEMAMPRIRQDGQATLADDRGDFGFTGDLSVAVSRSLQRWRDELASDPPMPFPEALVGSLSLAFEIPGGQVTTADKAVLAVLQAAACHGAELFAASGNVAGEGLTGLPYPAAWRAELEPTSAKCDALLGVDFMAELESTYLARTMYPLRRVYSGMGKAHLLRAVGGADAGGKILTKSRENACPDLAAQGLGLAVPGESELVFTGSSVPTALVAGIAAAALAQDPPEGMDPPYLSAHPQHVLDEIVANSPSLTFKAEGPCGPSWGCGDVPWIGGPAEGAGGPQNTQSSFPWADFDEIQFSPWPEVCTQTLCGQQPTCIRPVVSPVAEIRPQPEVYPCGGGCIVELPSPSTGLTVNPSFFIRPGMDLRYAKLLFEEGTARVRLDVTGPNDKLLDGSRYQFSLDRAALLGITLSSARVTFSALTASAGTSVTEQVLIVQRP